MKRLVFSALVALSTFVGGHVFAAEDLNAFKTIKGSEISFALGGAYSNATLTIVGPDGQAYSNYSKAGNPAINLIREKATADGLYTYEVTAASSQTRRTVNVLDNGRGNKEKSEVRVAAKASGSFEAKGGLIIEPSGEEEEKR